VDWEILSQEIYLQIGNVQKMVHRSRREGIECFRRWKDYGETDAVAAAKAALGLEPPVMGW
jgi:hypothetical protein